MIEQLSPDLLHILQHSLGVDQYGQGEIYRNHYVAGGDQLAKCRELVGFGFMVERQSSQLTGGDPWFSVTETGKLAVAIQSPKPEED